MKHALIAVLAVILTATLSCQESQNTNIPPNDKLHRPNTIDAAESESLSITDEKGLPIASAYVLIGDQATEANPWLLTDENGQVPVPETWTAPSDLTIDATDYIRVTLKDQTPGPLTLALKKKSQFPNLSMRGNVQGITTKDKDGFVDFAILLESMTKNDILNFNINKVVSPWTEKISVAGFEVPVPQNLFLPKQKESYLFLTVTLQKAWFNLSYDSYGVKSIYSLQGKFPMKKVLSELQSKKPYYELVNHFDFSSAGRANHDFSATSSEPVIDTTQIKLNGTYSINAPKIAAGQVLLGLSSFKENNVYQPLDLKYMESEKNTTFKTNSTVLPYFIGVIKNNNEFTLDSADAERMSVVMQPPLTEIMGLPLMKNPSWSSATELEIDMPVVSSSEFTDQGMLVVISEMQNVTLADGKVVKYKVPVWEIHASNWAPRLVIPNIATAGSSKRVEVTLLATATDNSGQQNAGAIVSTHEERIENATHLTKSASDY